jgi:hypothetical protein
LSEQLKRIQQVGLGLCANWLLAAILPFVVAGAELNTEAQAPSEYQVKAVFLLNFAKFIDWPAAAFRNGRSPITICVVGDDPFGPAIDATVKGQSFANRSFSVRRVKQIPGDDTCQIAFVSGAEKARTQVGTAIRALPILTVGEDDATGEASGIINFVIEESKVRFDVNLDEAERAGIKISSKLLKLAKRVHEKRKN